ncbi:unnamed protein product [Sphagnum jensenii]|uniref:DUF569 domain-containing protein n=1 Tax=Sphagnum jensenii TaxID=128206 RepID=A0ABP0WSJ1_9BRYO
MEVFERAATVRLKSIHGRSLRADGNRKSVSQTGDGRDVATVWNVEQVTGGDAVRFKSMHDLYLAETDFAYILGLTGKKVIQSYSSKADSAVEWQPISQGKYVKLKTRKGTFLRANGVMIPGYRNSVTHDIPESPATQSWILWEVQVVESITRQPPVEEAPIHLQSFFREKENVSLSPYVSIDSDVTIPTFKSEDEEEVRKLAQITLSTEREQFSPKIVLSPAKSQNSFDGNGSPTMASPGRKGQMSPNERPRALQRPQRVSVRHSNDYEEEERPRTPPQRGFESHYDAYEVRPRTSVSHFDAEEERPRTSPRVSMNRFDVEQVSPTTPRKKHRNSLRDRDRGQGHEERVTPSSPSKRQSGSPREQSLSARSSSSSSSSSSLNPDSHRIFYTVTNENGASPENTDWGSFVFDSSSVSELKEELQKRTGINEDILVGIRSPLSSKLSVYREELLPEGVAVMLEVVKVNSPVGRMLSKPHSVRTVYSRGNSTDFQDSVR